MDRLRQDLLGLRLPGRELCTGCGACAAACPRHALLMCSDDEGFLYPNVDAELCIRCGRCSAVCPTNHPFPTREPISVWAARAEDEKIRQESSSGGVFTLLAQSMLEDGGVVFGAAFGDGGVGSDRWRVRHVEVTGSDKLGALRGSKYVQSDLGTSFRMVLDRLCAHHRVLFVGTPCQTAGLSAYLKATLNADFQTSRENLLLVSVICHAAPSPLAWESYLEEESEKGEVASVAFRDKTCGWTHYQLKVSRAGGGDTAASAENHPFLRAFLSELCNRRSCAQCACRNLRTDDDLMLGDYWNVASRFLDLDDDRGTSLVLVNSSRGEKAWRKIAARVRVKESDWAHAQAVNPALIKSTPYTCKRDLFFKRVGHVRFTQLVCSLLQPPWTARMKVKLAHLRNWLFLRRRP